MSLSPRSLCLHFMYLACCLLLSCGICLAISPLPLNSSDAHQAWMQSWDGLRAGGVCSVSTSSAVDPNDGTVVTVGYATGTFLSHSNAGGWDAFVIKSASSGVTLWTRWFSTAQNDLLMGVCIDSASQIYLSGTTAGYMQGQTNSGQTDHFMASLDATGNQRWLIQFGSSSAELAGACDTDYNGFVYTVGMSNGGLFSSSSLNSGYYSLYMTRVSSATGNLTWKHNTGTSRNDQLLYQTTLTSQQFTCQGNAYGGSSYSSLSLSSLPTQQMPAGRGLTLLNPVQNISTVPIVLVFFWTPDTTTFIDNPVVGAGGYDSVIAAYNGVTGAFLWSNTYASLYDDVILGCTTDMIGAIYVAGYTTANLDGGSYSGTPNSQADVFLSKLTTNGTKLFTLVYGSSSTNDIGSVVSTDSAGGVYVAGITNIQSNSMVLDNQPNPYTNVTASTYSTVVVGFLSKFDSDGARLWTNLLSASLPAAEASSNTPLLAPLSAVVDMSSGQLYMSGRLEGVAVGESYPSGTASLTDILADQAFLIAVQQPPTNCSIEQFDSLLTQINTLLLQL